jgi:peptidoglycan hydrolase-like protein with peptidoglycan-binding domain
VSALLDLPSSAAISEAADSLQKASTPEPFSKSRTSNWVARGGGLPAYIQHVAHDLMEKRGKSESNAIQMAIGIVKNWASGKGKVDANTRAAAQKAVAEWEKLKAGAHGKGSLKEAASIELDDEQIGDLALLEATTTKPPLSNAPRRPGESLHSWGQRLNAGDAANANAAKKTRSGKSSSSSTTRSGGSNSAFNALHPRGRGGEWTLKQGASGQQVRNAQAIVGAKVDGQYGSATAAAVRKYQQKHGLKVDGVIGRQTLAQMNGQDGKKVKPGAAPAGSTIRKTTKGKLMETPLDNLTLVLEDDQIGDLSLLEAASSSDEAPGNMKIKCPKCDAMNRVGGSKKCEKCGHDLGDAIKAKMAKT